MKSMMEDYLGWMEFNRRATPATLKNYRSTLSRFSAWAGDRPFDEIAINGYLQTIENPVTQNVTRTRLLGALQYNPNKVVANKVPVKPIEALRASQVDALVLAATDISIEVAALIQFLSETGLRFQEFLDFRSDDIQTENISGVTQQWFQVIGKGRKTRTVPLSARAAYAVPKLPRNPTQWQQERIRAKMVDAGIAAGIGIHVHPHLLRASFISISLNERKKQAIVIAKIVGHSSVDTMLNHYFRESISTLCEAVVAA